MMTSLPRVATIVTVTDESPTVRTFVFDLPLEADPGQFVMAWLPGVDERPFSLVSAEPVTLAIARVGRLTTAVHALGVGDRLWLRGPLGHGFALPDRHEDMDGQREGNHAIPGRRLPLHRPILLIGGGYGVAPLHFLAERAMHAGWEVSVVIGARTAAEVILAGRFAALGARVVIATDDGSLGQQGMATDAAQRLLDEQPYQAVYACGPEPMLEAVERLARSRCLPAQLSYERAMRCGFGVCGTCARGGWLVCRDGPVMCVG